MMVDLTQLKALFSNIITKTKQEIKCHFSNIISIIICKVWNRGSSLILNSN